MSKTEHIFGWRKDKRDERDYLHAPRPRIVLPDVVDLSAHLPPVRDQGNLGSCVGMAIAAKLGATAKKQDAFEEIFSPTWIYNGARLLDGSLNEDCGAYPRDAFRFLLSYGCLLEHFRPYRDTLDKTDPRSWTYDGLSVLPEAAKWPLIEYVRITNGVDHICSALSEGHFVALGSPWYSSWMSIGQSGLLPEDYRYLVGGHETLLYGYDRARGLFYGQNSWGTDWGNKGRFLMPFSAIAAFLSSWGYDAHYARVKWGVEAPPDEPPEPEPGPIEPDPKKIPLWIWIVGILAAIAAAALLIFT